ncbi:hypothetical protein ABZ916_24885 [Streptomyces sp. NPDC046853]|uniref:hypothetical protein n=1 Tax=Streptomyces sp. NPDC046853 TaxID=3154920 RepID=UPI0033DEEED4
MLTARRVAVGTAGLILVGAAGAIPANASASTSTAAPVSTVAAADIGARAGGTAPACIERTAVNIPDGGTKVYIRNLCGKTMRVRVIVKHWPDSGCKTMANRTGWLYRSLGGQYDRTVVC